MPGEPTVNFTELTYLSLPRSGGALCQTRPRFARPGTYSQAIFSRKKVERR